MSADPVLTDEDEAVLDHLDSEPADADGPEDYEAIIADLRDELRRHKAEFRRFRHEAVSRLEAVEQTQQASTDQNPHYQSELQRLAQVPPKEWANQLSTSEEIAVTLHTNWDEIAWSLGNAQNRKSGVDTNSKANAKYNPSRLKHRLTLHLDWEPAWQQIYRGLKRLAKLSGSDELVDERTSRVQILGGEYMYSERATSDGKQTKRVVWRAPE